LFRKREQYYIQNIEKNIPVFSRDAITIHYRHDPNVQFPIPHSPFLILATTNFLLHIATSEIASFCIDNRLASFVFIKVGKGRLSSFYFQNKEALSVVVFSLL